MMQESKADEMESYIQVVTTTEKKEDAEKIAACLVEKRLAACVQIAGPISSLYRWKGKIERARRVAMLDKKQRGSLQRN